MKDTAAFSATVWVGALQAAATVSARHRWCWRRLNPDREARRILELAACIIKHLPNYDQRMQPVIAGARGHARRGQPLT
jgi:hypothetical protein